MEAGTTATHDGNLLSLRDLERHNNLIIDLSTRQGTRFNLQKELQKRNIYASKKTVRNIRDKLDLKCYIRSDHMSRMIGIRQKWKKKGINIDIKYKGKLSTAKIDRALADKIKKNGSESHALTALEDYSGATPKEIYYYDAKNPDVSLLDLDGCPWQAADRYEAIGFLDDHVQRSSPKMNPQSQLLAASSSPQLGLSPEELTAYQSGVMSGTVTATSSAPRTVWEWVSTAANTTSMLSSGNNTFLCQRALALYESHSGNTSYDPYFMEALSDQLLDNYQLDEADEVASLGVALADSLFKSTDVQSLLARSKLANVRNIQGKYHEAYHIGQVAVDSLKTKCSEYDEDVLKAECCLSDTLLELGELEKAETVCRNALNRSIFVADETVLSLKFQLAKICNSLGNFHEAKEILEFVATEWENRLGFSADITLRVHTELGYALQGLGSWDVTTRCVQIEHQISQRERNGSPRSMWTVELVILVAQQQFYCGAYVEAEVCFRNAFEHIQGRVQSSSHPKVVLAEAWIACALCSQGKTREAAAIYKKIVSVSQGTIGFHHPDTLIYMHNLAWALKEEITFAEFEARVLHVHDLRVRYLGEDHPDVIDSGLSCAKLKATRGEWDDSLDAFEKVYKAQKKINKSPACPKVMTCLLDHSLALGQRSDDIKAEKMQRKALALGKRLFGADHPRALRALIHLSDSLSRMSRYPEAGALLSEGISTLSGSLGNQHPKVMELKLVYAEVLVSQGRYNDAAELQSRVLNMYRAKYGEDHPYTINVKKQLAENYLEQNKFVEAQKLLDAAIQSCTSTFGPDHRMICQLELLLARLHRKQRRLTQALRLGQKVWTQSNKSLGYIETMGSSSASSLEHPEAIAALENLAFIRIGLGENAESTRLFDKILSLHTKFNGPTHPHTIGALSNLAWAYTESQDYDIAEQLYGKVVDNKSATFGEWHSQTISARLDLGLCLRNLNKFSKCEEMFVEMLKWLFDRYGENHKDVARTYNALAYLHGRQENYAEAEKYLKNALRIFKELGSDMEVNETMVIFCECYAAMEEYSKAEDQAEQTIYHLGTALERSHPVFTRAKMVLANALCKQQKYVEADNHIESLRQDIKECEGLYSSRLLRVELLHAYSMYAQGRIRDAEACLESCISQRQCQNIGDPNLCKMKRMLGDIKGEQGMLPEKEAILQDVLESLERNLLREQNLLKCRNSANLNQENIIALKRELAENYALACNFELELSTWQEITTTRSSTSDPDQQYIRDLQSLAGAHYSLEHYEEAEMRYECLNSMIREKFPENIGLLTSNLRRLAAAKEKLGKVNEAESSLEQAVLLSRGNPREKMPKYLKTLDWLACIKMKACKWTAAQDLFTEWLVLREQIPEYHRPPIRDQQYRLEFINSILDRTESATDAQSASDTMLPSYEESDSEFEGSSSSSSSSSVAGMDLLEPASEF